MTKVLPPYPRFGECIATLASALDIKKADSDVGRLAREGDFDWERLDAVVQEILVDGIARVVGDAAAQSIFAPWLMDVRGAYTRVVLDVSLDAVGRSDVLPVLIEKFFAPAVAKLLEPMHTSTPSLNLGALLAKESYPVKVTLEWLDALVGGTIEKLLYPESTGSDRVEQEKLRKWRSGIDIPSSQSIKLLCRQLEGRCESVERCAMWLLIASAMSRLERSSGESLRPLILHSFDVHSQTKNSIEASLSTSLSNLVRRVGHTWPELAEPGRKLWYDLCRTTPKQIGDQARTWNAIESLVATATESDPEGHTVYHYEWMKGRWHVLSGQYQEALPHYERAFEMACYRAGHQVKDILSEASCIAAFLGKKPFLKRLKHVGIALGLFRKPENGATVEDWEFDHFAKQLPIRFPSQGRFTECPSDLTEQPMQGLLILDEDTVSKIPLDLKTVNRVRAVHFANGEVRRWPQLRLFASFGLLEQVKALLDGGASVDDLDSSGGSALLCAMQYAESTGRREVLDLLLAQPHQIATINAQTQRRRLTPLMCAIDLGLPDVVEALVAQGADVEKRAPTDNQSPLYYLVTQLFWRINPQCMLAALTTKMMEEPDVMLQDTLRRFGVRGAGTFGSDTTASRANPELTTAVVKHFVNQHISKHTVSSLMRMAATLLKAGANPNAPHTYPARGSTPLMLAAESDLLDLLELMIRHGGDPLRPNAMGKNCTQIAREFRSLKVLSYLERTSR